jgi:D-alanyl-lipoteichoic acid acyltransferase DltB (MBOAT superfamily)
VLFHEPRYLVFLLAVYLGFWALERRRTARHALLLAASCAFYMSWNPALIALVFVSTTVDWFAALRIEAAGSRRARRAWLGVSLGTNLGLLGFFKYAGFFVDGARAGLAALGLPAPLPVLEVILPVGISFYTFQTLSYTVDVYRGVLPARRSLLDVSLFVLFFPQLVAGPIVRATEFLPQLDEEPRLWKRQGADALFRIARGLAKKVLLADVLAVGLVDGPFANPEVYSSLECTIAAYAYAFQIYLDFSAYSDIAIGSAALFGFRLPENFHLPYRASSLTEFWRRWHQTLSRWLRDYLYVPLGGSRRGRLRTYANLAITMVLGGLWHGAAWTFVAWGALHGAGLAIERALGVTAETSARRRGLLRVAGGLLTFHLVLAGWVLFRARTFGAAAALVARIADGAGGTANLAAGPLVALGVAAVSHLAPEGLVRAAADGFARLPVPARAVALALVALGLKQVATLEAAPFIYFQF